MKMELPFLLSFDSSRASMYIKEVVVEVPMLSCEVPTDPDGRHHAAQAAVSPLDVKPSYRQKELNDMVS